MDGNGKTPNLNELHRRQERLDGHVHDNARRIMALETGQARLETKIDALSETITKYNKDSERELNSLDKKVQSLLDTLTSKNGNRDRFNQMWGAAKIIGFALMLIATSSTAVVMLL